jgi:hypothetical protein
MTCVAGIPVADSESEFKQQTVSLSPHCPYSDFRNYGPPLDQITNERLTAGFIVK